MSCRVGFARQPNNVCDDRSFLMPLRITDLSSNLGASFDLTDAGGFEGPSGG
jgi:hypothetical protein